jgi:hypothetical protein
MNTTRFPRFGRNQTSRYSRNEKLQPTCTACMPPLSARGLKYCMSSVQPLQHISVVVGPLRAHTSADRATLRQTQAKDGAPPTQPTCGKCLRHHATPTTDRSCCHSHAVGTDGPCKCWPHITMPRQRQTHAHHCNSHHDAADASDTSGTVQHRQVMHEVDSHHDAANASDKWHHASSYVAPCRTDGSCRRWGCACSGTSLSHQQVRDTNQAMGSRPARTYMQEAHASGARPCCTTPHHATRCTETQVEATHVHCGGGSLHTLPLISK